MPYSQYSRHTLTKLLAATACSGLLFACGGGSGGGTATPAPTPTPDTPPTSETPPPATPTQKQFSQVSADESGIDFVFGFANPTNGMPDMFAGGSAAGDYDNDGDVDLFVVRGDTGPNLLYVNQGDGTFLEDAENAGLAFTQSSSTNFRHSGPTFTDMDGDNDLDLFLGGLGGDPSLIFQNNGNGTFSDVTASSGIDAMGATYTISAAFGDYDLDGDLDMMLAHWGTSRTISNPGDTEHLWRNDSTGSAIRFSSVSVESGISANIFANTNGGVIGHDIDYTFTPTFVKINDDIYPDILSVADSGNTRVFINNGDGTFRDETDTDQIIDVSGMGSAVGDYDNDGDMDWFVSAIRGTTQLVGSQFYQNNDGVFANATTATGVNDGGWGWAACFSDFNNDGRLDLYHTNGWPETVANESWADDTGRLFIANTDNTFTDHAETLGVGESEDGRAVVCADFDNDNDTDIFVTTRNATNAHLLFRNDMTGVESNNALSILLVGDAPNTQAIGARIRVTIDVDNANATQLREVTAGSNFTSQNPTTQIFGLGDAAMAARVEIEWPSLNGEAPQVDSYTDISPGSLTCSVSGCN